MLARRATDRLTAAVRRFGPGSRDWLRWMEYVLLVSGAVVVAQIVGGLLAAARRQEICAPVLVRDIAAPPASATLRSGAMLLPYSQVDVCVARPGWDQAWLNAATFLPVAAVVLAVALLLLRVVRAARTADPFIPAAVRRLRLIGAVVLFGGMGAEIVQHYARVALVDSMAPDGRTDNVVNVLLWLFAGVAAYAVAAVFERGAAMRAELETVI